MINPKHSLSYVKGLGGTNLRTWLGVCPFVTKNMTWKQQIWATVWVYIYYRNSHSRLEALTRYKGYSNLGRKQAKTVIGLIK